VLVFSAWAVTGLAAARSAIPLAFGTRDQLLRARQVGWDHDLSLIAWAPDASAQPVSVRLPLVTIRPESS